jgi:hypothetical protein
MMTESEFMERVERHGKWLRDEPGGERLSLAGTEAFAMDLTGVDLRRAYLEDVSFAGSALAGAKFGWAGLRHVVFDGVNMVDASFKGADLFAVHFERAVVVGVDFQGAHVTVGSLRAADCRFADFSDAVMTRVDLTGANFRRAVFAHTAMKGADLRGADIDMASFGLWCGSLGWTIDSRIARQLAYHFCAMECDDPEFVEARKTLLPFANQFHRVKECGILVDE